MPNHLVDSCNHNHELCWCRDKSITINTLCSFHAHLLFVINLTVHIHSWVFIICAIFIFAPTTAIHLNKYRVTARLSRRHVLSFGEGSQQTGLQGLNYQHQHFHHVLHLSKLPYQQQDLKAAQETTISAFWCTIKRCQTRFLLHCFGSGCQRIKHYLKEDSFSREKQAARFTDGKAGAQEPQGMWVTKEHKRNGNRIRKVAVGAGAWGEGGTPTFLPASLLGSWWLRHWSSSTQVSGSAGPWVKLGSGPKLPDCHSGERRRRHKITVAQMPTGETESSNNA